MKVAFIHPSWPGSEGTGATHSATQVVHGLAERGHDVHVFCTESIPEDHTNTTNLEMSYLPDDGRLYHYQGNLRLNNTLKNRAADFEEYDVVHSYLTITLPALETIGRETSAATAVTLNAYGGVCPKNDLYFLGQKQCTAGSLTKCTACIGRTSFDDGRNPARLTASRFANLKLVHEAKQNLEHVDAFRAPSGHVKKNYVQHGFSSERIHVIPHPLNSDFLVDHRSEFAEPFRLLYVGFLKQKKGVDNLIPIVARLREQIDISFTLSIVGKGPRENHMREQAQKFGVEDAVEFRGFISNEKLPGIYANHDLFVYPSLWEEPLGRVYLESLATGTPIISSGYGSIENIMGDGGVAVRGDVGAFARTIAEFLDGESLEEMSVAAMNEARKFHRESVVGRIESMYEEIIVGK
ncbi:glycosyltransferase family 4 protein [Natrialba sp. PRR66]|uniref:glycosyltransferase family 4 protein n=1 Tax=Natrialba sp. PRR66 TaxID=3098146 RepID=UPI002B1DCECE|nr:glycosyltransferase family 4 protein [Natrialba sp. PRR66]